MKTWGFLRLANDIQSMCKLGTAFLKQIPHACNIHAELLWHTQLVETPHMVTCTCLVYMYN